MIGRTPGVYRPVSGDGPCKECPFRRRSAAGWLGGATPQSFIVEISMERPLPCHPTLDYTDPDWLEKWAGQRSTGRICAGSLILSANMGKLPRDPAFPRLPPDDGEVVFRNHREFIAHHEGAEVRSWELSDDAPKEIRPMNATTKTKKTRVPEILIADDRDLSRLIAHSRIGRQNAHTRALRADAQAVLAGDPRAPRDSCAKILHDLRSNPDSVGVYAIERSPMNKLRWVLSLFCGHEAWATSSTRPAQRLTSCEICRRTRVAEDSAEPPAPAAPTSGKHAPAGPRRRKFWVRADVEVELDQRVIDVALTPEWQESNYRFDNEREVVEHIAFNLMRDRRLTSLDGWADQEDNLAQMTDLEVTESEEILPPVGAAGTRRTRPAGRATRAKPGRSK